MTRSGQRHFGKIDMIRSGHYFRVEGIYLVVTHKGKGDASKRRNYLSDDVMEGESESLSKGELTKGTR